ncbi:MAG: class I adenylate-forming enzyme family protein, partial [Geminicoccaceae bacterium]
TPGKPALHFGDSSWTYAAFQDRIARCARGLHRDLALKPGDRILYLGYNHLDFLVLLFAAARLGLILIPLNWRLSKAEHRAIIADAVPSALVVAASFRDYLGLDAWDDPACRLITIDWQSAHGVRFDDLLHRDGDAPATGRPLDPLLIVYTSGTTGLAKGAMLTQDVLFWNAANSQDMHTLKPDDHVLTVLPMFHVGGLHIQTLPALALGAEVSLEGRFEPAATLRLIETRRATLTVLVPATLRALIDHPEFAATDLSSLRQVATGSSIVPIDLIQAFHARGIPVAQIYGTTETAPIAVYQHADDARRAVGSCGKAGRHSDLKIVDDAGNEVEKGTVGEILIRGPHVMSGYWQNQAATDQALIDGWFHTGDLGRLDQTDNLWIEGRQDDLIKSGSERIYPGEIEALLRGVPGIDDLAVIGKSDPDWGEVPVAVIQQVGDQAAIGVDDLTPYLDGKLARFKWPKAIVKVDSLPRSALGKILRYRLREMLS